MLSLVLAVWRSAACKTDIAATFTVVGCSTPANKQDCCDDLIDRKHSSCSGLEHQRGEDGQVMPPGRPLTPRSPSPPSAQASAGRDMCAGGVGLCRLAGKRRSHRPCLSLTGAWRSVQCAPQKETQIVTNGPDRDHWSKQAKRTSMLPSGPRAVAQGSSWAARARNSGLSAATAKVRFGIGMRH